MKNVLISLALVFGVTTTAHAIPIQLNQAQFLAATSGLTTVVEDFESFAVGGLASPVTLANATYTAIVPQIRENTNNSPTKRLFENAPDPATGRNFTALLANTTLFGADVATLVPLDLDVLDITVVGGSGVLNVQASFASLNEFFAVSDPLGLISLSFKNIGDGLGSTAWGFDNVTTAAADVPTPATLALFGIGLAGLGWLRRKKA